MPRRFAWFIFFSLLAVPSILFALYYYHVLPEWEWFYTLRSWRGSELLVVFLGCAGGALASMLPRRLLILPLLATGGAAMAPHIKPIVCPLEASDLKDRFEGMACFQSTGSTCGPASVCSILHSHGARSSESVIARAAYSTASGTEAWYLARYVRSQGFVPTFHFDKTFSTSAGLPAMVGVLLAGNGHFIAVLDMKGDQVSVADPLRGEEHLPLAVFLHSYHFTGFHMVVTKN